MSSRVDNSFRGQLTGLGEFRDAHLERRFRLEHESQDARQLVWICAAAAVLFLSFTALDRVLFGTGRLFAALLGVRLVTAAVLLGLAWHLVCKPAQVSSGVCATIAESVLALALLAVAAIYPISAFSSVEQGLTIYVLAVYFLVPSRWILTTTVSLIGTAAFLIIATLRWTGPLNQWATMVALLCFANFIGAVGSHRLHALRRLQYHALRSSWQSNDQLRRAADTDGLTRLLNRRRFFSAAAVRLAEAHKEGLPCSVLFFDVDHFKSVNDAYGHAAGDQCLRYIASICRAFFRSGDLVGRTGGEEFAVFLEGSDEEAAAALAERLRADIEASPAPAPLSQTPTVTIGVAQCTESETNIEPAIQRADAAMYRGKRAGRNQVVRATNQYELTLAADNT